MAENNYLQLSPSYRFRLRLRRRIVIVVVIAQVLVIVFVFVFVVGPPERYLFPAIVGWGRFSELSINSPEIYLFSHYWPGDFKRLMRVNHEHPSDAI